MCAIRCGSGSGMCQCTLENLNAIDPGLEENKKNIYIRTNTYTHTYNIHTAPLLSSIPKNTNTLQACVIIIS